MPPERIENTQTNLDTKTSLPEVPHHNLQLSDHDSNISENISNFSRLETNPIFASKHGDNRPYLNISINNKNMLALVDTGSNVSILGASALHLLKELNLQLNYDVSLCITTADGTVQNALGYVWIPITIDGLTKSVKLILVPCVSHELILGVDFLNIFNFSVNFANFSYNTSTLSSCAVNLIKDVTTLSSYEKHQLEGVINLYKEIGPTDRIGRTHLLTQTIDTGSNLPIRQRQYPLSHCMQKALNSQIDEMLKLDIIEPTNSPWSSPLWLVNKTDGSYRVCFDGRKLNTITVRDSYPMPLIDSIVTKVRDANFLSSIDLKFAFYQIPLDESSKIKTAFAVSGRGSFCFKVMPFGLNNSAQAMCRLMDMVIGPALDPYVFYYLDDIIIATPDFATHLDVLKKLYLRLKEANLTVNFDKCVFCRPSLKFLGFVVDDKGLRTDPEKVSAILDYPIPTNSTEVRRFLGLVMYYRRFLKDFSTICSPITDLLRNRKKGQPITWTPDADRAFAEVKRILTNTPVLASPDFSKQFIISCDASNTGVGAVLYQEDDGLEHPIAFFSKTLNKCQRKYTTTEKELLAVVYAIEKFRCYVDGTHFLVYTDNSSITWLNSLKNPSPRLARWLVKLAQYKFDIVHKKGSLNNVADALSREHEHEVCVLNLSDITPDHWYREMLTKVRNNPDLFPSFKVENNILYKHVFTKEDSVTNWKIVVPTANRPQILRMYHDSETAAHFGFFKTFGRIAELYYWPKMRDTISHYIRSCKICASCKADNLPQAGLMGNYRNINFPFQLISADLLGPYPRSRNGNQYLLVVVDWFTKFPLVHPMSKPTSKSIVKFLENHVFLTFGVPQIISVDNGPQFISKEFKSLCDAYKVQKIWFNARYHPQINHTERVNRVITTAIRSFIRDSQKDWDRSIFKICQAIRLSRHEVTGITPAFLTFSRNVPVDGSFYGLIADNANNKVEISKKLIDPQFAQKVPELYSKVQERLFKAYLASVPRYNLRKRDVRFQVGSRVWRRNFTLSKAANDFSAKLAPKYVPCVVDRVISPLVYRLKDLNGKILGNFHVKDIKLDVTDGNAEPDNGNT